MVVLGFSMGNFSLAKKITGEFQVVFVGILPFFMAAKIGLFDSFCMANNQTKRCTDLTESPRWQ